MVWQYVKQPAVKRFFTLSNDIFSLGLSSGALAVYSYLLYCEDRKTYQCWPSYRSIGKAVRMSINNGAEICDRAGGTRVDRHRVDLHRYKGWPQEKWHSALYHPADSKCGGPLQPTTVPTVGGNSRADACPQEAGEQRGTPYPSSRHLRQNSLIPLLLLSPHKRCAFVRGPHLVFLFRKLAAGWWCPKRSSSSG